VTISLKDPNGKLIKSVKKSIQSFNDTETIATFSVSKPLLWSPDQPRLYTIETELNSSSGKHVLIEKTGFRDFQFIEHGPFMLNGERLLLRGTHRHEDHAGVAAAMTEDMM